jgi:PAS domain S-box-containing protein
MMRSNPSKANLQKPSVLFNSRLNRFDLLPVPLLTAAILLLWFADLRTPYEYPLLLTILNFIFLTLAALLVMFLAWRSYLKTEEYGLLMLGCGAFLWAIGGSASFLVLGKGINAVVTVHNSLACLAAFCLFSGVTLSQRWKKTKMPGLILSLLSAASLVAAGIIIIMTVYGWMPVFFVQGQGGTHIRQAVLVLAILLFGHTAVSLLSADRRNPSVFVRWYGAALLLLTTGLLGVLLQPAFGGLLGWAGRVAQYLGGIYMLIAAITSMRERGMNGLSLNDVLSESESRFRALSEATVEGIGISEHGRIIDVNEQFAGMYGYTRDELIGMEVAKLLPPDEVERVMANIHHNIESVIEHRGLRRDGQILTLEAHARNIVYMGRPARLTTIHDITERKKTEEALLKSKESYKELVTNANSIIIRMNKNGTITFFNEYAQKFFGYTLDEILGKDVKILIPQTESNGKNLSEMADNILRNPDGFEENINENIRKNGERIWVLWKNKSIRDSNGNIIGNLAIGSDITERIRAEQALKESEAVLRSFFDSPGVMRGIVEVIAEDDVRHITNNSATADFIGITPEAMKNKTGSELGEPSDILRVWVRHYIESRRSGKPVTFEYLDKRRDAWLMATVSYLGTPPHGYPRFGYVVQDITQRRRIEESLRVKEVDLNKAQGLAHVGSWFWDAKTDATTGTEELLRIYGFDPDTQTMPDFKEQRGRCYPVEDWELVNEAVQKTLNTGIGYELDVHAIRNGETIWITTRGEAVRDADNRIVGMRGTVQDITERKYMEESLRKSEEQYRALVENLPDLIARFDLDLRLTYANPAVLQLTGKAADELIRKTPREYGASPAAASLWEQAARLAIDTGKPQRLDQTSVWHGETRIYDCISIPEHGVDGIVTSIINVSRDITERKQAEDALERSEARFKLLSETAEQLIKFKDIQFVVNNLCKKTMEHLDCQVFFNYLLNAKVGRLYLNAFSGIPDEDARKIEWLDLGVAVCGCAALEASPIIAENIRTTPDPRTDLVKSYGIQAYACHPLMVQGKAIGTLSFGTGTRPSFSDEDLVLMKRVTAQVANAMERSRLNDELQQSRDELELKVQDRTAELKKINEALARSNLELENFANVASHDLQEPLRKIRTFAERLTRMNTDSMNDTERDYLERMQGSAERMHALIQDLVKYSRVTSAPKSFKVFNLRSPAEDAVRNMSLILEETGGRIDIDELPDIEGSENLIYQLFQNLIGNALKYRNNEKPLIRIKSIQSSEVGFHEIHVEDNGIGFDEMYLDKIFKPFQRLHGRSSPYQGTGMGLAICHKIVEIHGGSITAKSEPNKGSTFIVKLPKISHR